MNESNLILLVEDNDDDVFFMKRALERSGIKNPLQILRDGQKAVDYLSGANEFSDGIKYPQPKLVLLDLKLPLKSGLDVLAWARKEQHVHEIIFIVLTSSKERNDIDSAFRLGANAYVVKPTGLVALTELMRDLGGFWLKHNQFRSDKS